MKNKTYSLKDLATIKYGKNQKQVQDENGKIPIYGTGGVIGYSTKSLYDSPSVLIGRKGTIGKVKFVSSPFWTIDTLFYTEVNIDIVYPKYLYYVMSLLDLNQYNEGTAIPSLRTETLNRLEFDIPSLQVQEKILDILNPLDDKIELNNRINDNLEQQAQAIFKYYFIDFEPFGGTMPDDWSFINLSDIAEITSGKRPIKKQKFFSSEFQIPIVGATSIMGYTNKILYNEKILVIGRVGTHGVVQRFNSPCWTSDNTLIVKTLYYEYIFQILHLIDYKNLNRGSTQPLITQTDLNKIKVINPPKKYILNFENVVGNLMTLYENNINENKKLSEIRDSLLPKLMSGEIDINTKVLEEI